MISEDEEPSQSNVSEADQLTPELTRAPQRNTSSLTGQNEAADQQQTWITNTATTLESNGVVMQRFSGGKERGPPPLTRKPIFPDERGKFFNQFIQIEPID